MIQNTGAHIFLSLPASSRAFELVAFLAVPSGP